MIKAFGQDRLWRRCEALSREDVASLFYMVFGYMTQTEAWPTFYMVLGELLPTFEENTGETTEDAALKTEEGGEQ